MVEGIGNCAGEARTTFEIVEGAKDESSSVASSSPIPTVAIVPIVVALIALAVICAFILRRRKARSMQQKTGGKA